MMLQLLLAGVTLTFPMEAGARGTEITLGEIATVTGDDAAEVAAIEAVPLGYAPMPGHSRLFHALRVAQLVQRRSGVPVALAGHAACRVWPVVEEVPAATIEEAAAAELERLAAGLDVDMEPAEPILPTSVPAGVTGWAIRAELDDDALRTGRVPVPVRVLVDGAVYRTIWTSWRVSVYETRTVLARPVRAGEQLGLDAFVRERVPVARPGDRGPLGGHRIVGAVATRDLDARQLVTELDVRRPIAVKSGDTIFLQARKGGVTARVPAVARQHGAIGDRILVSLLVNGREMSAVILSQDLVEIDLGS